MRKIIMCSVILSALFVITGGCGTEKKPNTLDVSEDITNDVDLNEDNYEKVVMANNKLAFKMLEEIETDENGNSFISPLSLYTALSMVYNGTDGITKEEMAKVLQAEGIDIHEFNQANASLLKILNKDSNDIELKIANSIWLNKRYHFQADFSKHNQDYFNAKIEEIDVSNRESAQMINDWVKQATNEKITDIVNDGPLNTDLVTLLINAIYFHGDWMFEFDKALTTEGSFYVKDKVTENVQFMSLSEELLYMEDDELQAVILPYGNGEMSMKVLLPKENSDLKKLEQRLMNGDWSSINKEFREREGTIVLPKFKLEYEIKLNDMLVNLGMGTAFDSEKANFSKMIIGDDPIWIDEVKQRTYIDVNEEGTEAAGVTSIALLIETAIINEDEPFYMEVNRPFFIMITDDETDAILFIGSITNPWGQSPIQ